LQLKPSKQLRSDEIYQQFRSYFLSLNGRVQLQDVLGDLKRYGTYYVAYSLGHEKDKQLKEVFRRLRQLIEVASPVILRLYDCYFRHKTLPLEDFIAAVRLLESYVFRRSVCDMQTRSLGQIFANLAYRIKDEAPLLSLKVALYRQGKKRRYPSDAEFKEALETRDVYDMRTCHYLLDRLENDSKENIDTSTFSIEHVMPQNEELCPEWQAMLGETWKEIQELWLHRLGNVTLTGYNSEYSDRPFDEKKSIKNGFSTSPLRLNKYISEQKTWTATEMEQRGKDLATKALKLWPPLIVDMAAVKNAELADRKAQAARFTLDELDFDAKSRKLFDTLRKDIIALGSDVVELCGAKSVTYRVYDFFVEIIPRKRKLVLNINLDFDVCDDPSERVEDSSKWAFIPNASETGGAVYIITEEDHIVPAMHLLRQAYESVAD
jgi:predicted transport protein